MKQQLITAIVACAAGLALGTQAQTSPGGPSTDPSSSSGSSTSPGTTSPSSAGAYGSPSSTQSGLGGRHLSATGRMGHEAIRGSQLTGALVNGSSGSEIGTISDIIINPASGRVEFAVLSLTGNSGAGSSSATSGLTSSAGISSATTSSAGGKQVAVPWMLLRSSSGASAGLSGATSGLSSSSSPTGTSTGASSQQPSFVFSGDNSKLESAPSFDATTDLNQASWRQSVFSYFGLSGSSSATGAAFTPGGSSTGSSTDSSAPASSKSDSLDSSSPGNTTPNSSSSSK